MSNEGLAAEVRRHFPSRLGGFTVTGKGSFPLVRRHANDYHVGRVVLLGDAAHTINPLAGQGSTSVSRMWPAGSTCCKGPEPTGIKLCWPSVTSDAVAPTTC